MTQKNENEAKHKHEYEQQSVRHGAHLLWPCAKYTNSALDMIESIPNYIDIFHTTKYFFFLTCFSCVCFVLLRFERYTLSEYESSVVRYVCYTAAKHFFVVGPIGHETKTKK